MSIKIIVRKLDGTKQKFEGQEGFTYEEYLAAVKEDLGEVRVMLMEVPRILEDQVA